MRWPLYFFFGWKPTNNKSSFKPKEIERKTNERMTTATTKTTHKCIGEISFPEFLLAKANSESFLFFTHYHRRRCAPIFFVSFTSFFRFHCVQLFRTLAMNCVIKKKEKKRKTKTKTLSIACCECIPTKCERSNDLAGFRFHYLISRHSYTHSHTHTTTKWLPSSVCNT